MSTYDFKAGKARIDEILNSRVVVTDQNEIPNKSQFTFDNGFYGWVTSVFVDIRNSHELFKDNDKPTISKIIRCFSSEIIQILRTCDNLREIGIRGDCVYAIYTTPQEKDVNDVAQKTFEINTYMHALNKMLTDKRYPNIQAGIGMSSARELVVMASKEIVDTNDLVWIGNAVTTASKLSSIANKEGYKPIVISQPCYDILISFLKEKNPEAGSWFSSKFHRSSLGIVYHANLVMEDYQYWIDNGMQV